MPYFWNIQQLAFLILFWSLFKISSKSDLQQLCRLLDIVDFQIPIIVTLGILV